MLLLCACSAGPPAQKQAAARESPPSTVGWTTSVSPPPTPSGDGVPCVDADRAGDEGAAAGGVRAGPFGTVLREQRGGVAKLWVAQDPDKGRAEALIRVEHVESGTVAYYVRDASATSTVLDDDGSPSEDKIYPGQILLPPDGHVRITVGIGRAAGCFAYTLR
ncbi:hypothetical protein B0I32_118280 [Nonomuraea fuscirosea]|uniref:Uncharacterized protein n=1 Tax=Nonomuraea fuscirosea TaxID=1291556 RepID=A0A2T0MPY9_9ACTN|nr:hypothetical protein B0I32_118280 [Nonomuraea fuscirosea]